MSAHPEEALPIVDHLRDLVPDAGHLRHMPTHLDILCGDYQKAISSNLDAICADGKFLEVSILRGIITPEGLFASHGT